MALITNCVDYYKLDGNLTDSAGSNNGTDHGSVPFSNSFGIINQGCSFDGSTQFISGGAISLASFDSGVSMSAWFKPASGNVPNRPAFTIRNAGGSFGGVLFNGTNILYTFPQSATHTSSAYTNGTWYHVVITHASTVEKIYINGTLISTDTGVTITTVTNAFSLGAGGGGGDNYFGDIDEAGIWTRALTQTDVTQLYNGGLGLQFPFSGGTTSLPFKTLLGVGI